MHYRNIPKTLLFLLLCCPSMGLTGCSTTAQGDTGSFSPADYVNPFIGASTSTSAAGVYHGLGKTFPGATTPYGMVQVSPNTITGGDNSPGYSYEHTTIEGFAFTQMSGVGWFGDLGNLLVMPTTGPLQKIAGREDGSIGGYRSHYDKATETARAGYYSALLTDYGIRAESSATPHCGILRFTFPEGEQSRIQIDLARRVGGTAERQYIEVVDKHTIAGWMKCTPATGGWGNGEGQADYTVYFYAQVDKPMENYGFWRADIPDDWVRKRDEVVSVPYLQRVAAAPVVTGIDRIEGRHIGFYTEFGTRQDEQVILRAGISFVDMEGARKNFEAEIAGKAFDQVAREARELWNRELARIRIDGGSDRQKTIFYTALYHTMIDPRCFTDVTGEYPGADGKIHTTELYPPHGVQRMGRVPQPDAVADHHQPATGQRPRELARHDGRRERAPLFRALGDRQRLLGLHAGQPGAVGTGRRLCQGHPQLRRREGLPLCRELLEAFRQRPAGLHPLGTVHFAHARIRLCLSLIHI